MNVFEPTSGKVSEGLLLHLTLAEAKAIEEMTEFSTRLVRSLPSWKKAFAALETMPCFTGSGDIHRVDNLVEKFKPTKKKGKKR